MNWTDKLRGWESLAKTIGFAEVSQICANHQIKIKVIMSVFVTLIIFRLNFMLAIITIEKV